MHAPSRSRRERGRCSAGRAARHDDRPRHPVGRVGHPALARVDRERPQAVSRSEEHTSELQSLMSIPYAVFCLKKKNNNIKHTPDHIHNNSITHNSTITNHQTHTYTK